MPSFRTGVVTEVLSERSGLQRVTVDGERAYVLTALTGPVAAAIGVRTTLVGAGAIGIFVTAAFLLVPGIRDTERSGALSIPIEGS